MATLIQVLETQLSQKDHLPNNAVQRIFLKEVLQSYVLAFIYNHKTYRLLNFYGGSCLRIIYGLNRMSEDIDLDNSRNVELSAFSDDLYKYFKKILQAELTTTVQQTSRSGIYRITMKFPVLYELQLSQHRDETLHLKIEISRHNQIATIMQTPVILYGKSFIPNHFSIESLMAGKILACLERSFRVGETGTDFKARDFYDLLWMMQKQIIPQNEKLAADGKEPYTTQSAITLLKDQVKKIKVRDLQRDLLPLFEDEFFITTWCESFHENFERFSQQYL